MRLSRTIPIVVLASAVAGSGFAQVRARQVMPTAQPRHARVFAWRIDPPKPSLTAPGQPSSSCEPSATACFYTPSNLQTAYGPGFIANSNGGAGITVAIVDAFYNSQTASDAATYSSAYGLPQFTCTSGPSATPCLTIVGQTGTTCPSGCTAAPNNTNGQGWAQETNLDIAAVHTMAPNANILLVTANSDANNNLYAAEEYAYKHASVVTNSWGSDESSGETIDESVFSASSVPLLFSAGDKGAVTEYPCVSAFTVCVGGTRLITSSASFRTAESAWGGSDTSGGGGGGCSSFLTAPNFQSGFSTTACGSARGVPDIAALADEYTGLIIYLGTFAGAGTAGYAVYGGTSLASPLMAGVFADIDADIASNSEPVLGSNLNSLLYGAAANPFYYFRFYDVTTGSTGFAAGSGWDQATGLGVILGPSLAAYLVNQQ
jgi:subtilase family serine protease